MYAVARNTAKDLNNKDYWVAEVIVIESDTYSAQPDDYLLVLGRADYNSQVLSNSRQAVGTQNVLAISAKQGGEIRITPTSYNWGTNTVKPGIYKAYGIAEVESGLYTVNALREVTPENVNDARDPNSANTNGFKLRAGVVTKLWALNDRIGVDLQDGSTPIQIDLKGAAMSVTEKSGRISVGHRMSGDYSSNLVKDSSKIFWVEDGSGNVLFAIDVTYSLKNSDVNSTIYSLLNNIYDGVIYSQNHKYVAGDHTVTVEFTGANQNHPVVDMKVSVDTRDRVDLTVAEINKYLGGVYTVSDLSNASITNTANGLPALMNGAYQIAQDTNSIGIGVITADLTVQVPVTLQSKTVKLASAWNDGTVYLTSTCIKTNTSVDVNTVVSVHVGDTVVLNVRSTTPALNSWYSLKIGDKDAITNQTGVFTFEMPAEDVTLTVSCTLKPFTVNFSGDDGITVKAENGTDKVGEAIPGTDFKFFAQPTAGVTLKKVEYAVNGGAMKDLTTYSNNVYTVALDANAYSLNVKFTTELDELTVTLNVQNGAPAVTMNGEIITGTKTMKVTMKDVFSFTTADAAVVEGANCVINYTPNGAYRTYTVSNVTANTTITVKAK